MPRDCLHFPVILHYQGYDELEVFADSEALTALLCNCGHLLPHEDRFIDSSGKVFVLNDQGHLETNGCAVTLPQFNLLLQKHFFALANSCAAKSTTDSIANGMLALLAVAER